MITFNQTKALRAIKFIENLKHTKGKFSGVPFKLLDWQHKIINDVYGTENENGTRQYQHVYLEVPKKNGKQLMLSTPIPTPKGVVTMGDLQVGDQVFDEEGKPCNVVALSPIDNTEQAYKITFKDGTHIVAGERHLWQVELTTNGKRSKLMTTGDMYKRYITKQAKDNRCLFRIPISKELSLDSKKLEIDPYLYGFWLGNGNAKKPEITINRGDVESIVSAIPYKPTNHYQQEGYSDIYVYNELKYVLLDTFRAKNIPYSYLYSNKEQRWELLRGLMDSDGCVSTEKGQSIYVTILDNLAKNVQQLLWSLGIKNTLTTVPSTRYGEPTGETCYLVKFTTFDDMVVSKLKRKTERSISRNKKSRSHYHYISSIEPLNYKVDMRCIQVDSPSHMYLAGESFVPTHNSELVAATGLYHTFADGEIKGEVYACAADRQQASLCFDVAVDMVDQNRSLKKYTKYTASKKRLENKINGTYFQVLSAEAFTKHGLNLSACIFDELHAQKNRELYDVMTFGSGDARLQPIWWVITTAGDDADRTSIGWEIHEKAKKIIDGEIVDPRWYCKIYGVDPDFEGDIYDENLWYTVNPSLGHTIDIDKVRQAAEGAKNSEAEEKLFRWLRLNQWVSFKSTGWLDLPLWDKTTGDWTPSDMVGRKCYLGLDLSSTTDLTGLTLLFPPDGDIKEWRFFSEAWIPEDNMKARVNRDHVPYDKWVKQKVMHVTPGNVIDYAFIRSRIEHFNSLYKVKYLCTDPWNSRMLTQELERTAMEVLEVNQNMANMSPGMKEIERLLKTGYMTHEENPCARWCFGNVRIAIDGNMNIKPMKNKSMDRIDVTVSLINAMSVAIKFENMNIYEGRGLRIL